MMCWNVAMDGLHREAPILDSNADYCCRESVSGDVTRNEAPFYGVKATWLSHGRIQRSNRALVSSLTNRDAAGPMR